MPFEKPKIDRSRRKPKGAARTLLLVVLAGVGLGLTLIWLGMPERGRPQPGAPSGVERGPGADPGLDPALETATGIRETAQGEEPVTLAAARRNPESDPRFRGKGEIRGRVEVQGDEPFPTVWRLTVRPSKSLYGRELAEERTIEFDDGRQDFTVEDLPLAGYDVTAEATGWNGFPQPILLDKQNYSPFLSLRLHPAGFLEGSVVDAKGLPADGIPITLLSLPDGETSVASTDVTGRFRFDRVVDGPYQLIVGHATSPILPERRPISFRAPSMILPAIELPPLGRIQLGVVDEFERKMPDVTIKGSGSRGGVFDGLSDAYGALTAEHLPAGRYRIRFDREGYRVKRIALELEPGEERELTVQMVPLY